MSKNKKIEISLKEKLEKALVPVEEQAYKIPNNWVWVGLKYISKKIFAGGDKPENFSKMKTDKNIFPIFSNGIDKDGLYGYTDETKVLEKGIGFQITKCCCDIGFEKLGMNMIYLEVFSDNIPALKTYLKVGFIERKRYIKNDREIIYMEYFK